MFLSVFQQWKILKRKGIGCLICDECHIVLVIALFVPVNSLEIVWMNCDCVTILDDFILRVACNIPSKFC